MLTIGNVVALIFSFLLLDIHVYAAPSGPKSKNFDTLMRKADGSSNLQNNLNREELAEVGEILKQDLQLIHKDQDMLTGKKIYDFEGALQEYIDWQKELQVNLQRFLVELEAEYPNTEQLLEILQWFRNHQQVGQLLHQRRQVWDGIENFESLDKLLLESILEKRPAIGGNLQNSLTLWQYVQKYAQLGHEKIELEKIALREGNAAVPIGRGPAGAKSSTLIVDGQPTEGCTWPWMVALTTADGLFVCGGSLVDRQYVLTAAHCVNYYFEELELFAQFGVYNLSADTPLQTIKVINITVHNRYNPDDHGYYDIALLKLAEPAATDKYPECIQTIQPATPNVTAYPRPHNTNSTMRRNCLILGWGRTDTDSDAISDVLLQKSVDVITNARCSAAWDLAVFSNCQIYPENICVKSQEFLGSTSCQGDSGGPLQCYYEGKGWILEGISSWGSAACKYYPSVYTRVSRFYAWIQTQRLATSL